MQCMTQYRTAPAQIPTTNLVSPIAKRIVLTNIADVNLQLCLAPTPRIAHDMLQTPALFGHAALDSIQVRQVIHLPMCEEAKHVTAIRLHMRLHNL